MRIYVTNNTLPGAGRSWWDAWNLNEPSQVMQRHDYRLDSLRVIEWWAAKMKGHDLVCLDIEHVRPRPTPAQLVRAVRAVRMFAGGTPVSLYGNHFGLPAGMLAKEYVTPTPRQAEEIDGTASAWASVYEACGTAFVDAYALKKADEIWIAPFVKKQAELCARYLPGVPVIAWVSATWNGTDPPEDLSGEESASQLRLVESIGADCNLWQPLDLDGPVTGEKAQRQPMTAAVARLAAAGR